jgi:Na+-transporting NADH:ubiquinone oxidoreductase subunit F
MILALNTATVGLAIVVVLLVMLLLVSLLLWAKAKLTNSGPVSLTINGEKNVQVQAGSTLLSTLSSEKIFLPSACGGGGTCAMCKCQVTSGGGEILPTEKPYFSRKEIADNWRLGCQVKVKEDMVVEVPEEVFGIKAIVEGSFIPLFIDDIAMFNPRELKVYSHLFLNPELKAELKVKD